MPSITSATSALLADLILEARKDPADKNPPNPPKKGKRISGWAVFIIIIIVLIILAAVAWVVYTRLRARRLGLPPPSLNPFAASRSGAASNYPAPAPGGVKGWLDAQVRKFKNRRYATGAYEEPSTGYGGAARGRAGHGPLDPDEAWDSRVGHEAYYEEQELGLHVPPPASGNTAYAGGSGYGYTADGAGAERGRSRTRELDDRYEEEAHGGFASKHDTNPFGDDNAVRPLEAERSGQVKGHKKTGSADSSPTERRSMFRENM